jgi:hypothetical protein
VLEGNPAAPGGDYTVRLKMPDGYRIAPIRTLRGKTSPSSSGGLKSAWEITLTKARWQISQPAVFAYLDPDMHHYAMASGEVVVQVHGASPLQFNYVNSEDDPSRKR